MLGRSQLPEPELKIEESAITRVELIDHTTKGKGREFVRYYDRPVIVQAELQDNGRTVKVFITEQVVPQEDKDNTSTE